jgi:signal transduction histidine kinase
MKPYLNQLLEMLERIESIDDQQLATMKNIVQTADKALAIAEFKLERLEKVKRTTSILLEETIEELEQKRIAVEKLALESSRQSSLDRIRAEIASMRSAKDLQQITPLIWEELKKLGIPFIRCGVFIMDEEDEKIHTYLSTPHGDSIAVLHLPFQGISLAENALLAWRNQSHFHEHWDEQDFNNWMDKLLNLGQIQAKENFELGSIPENLELYFIPFKQGMLYIGNIETLSEENLNLGFSLAEAFSIAYDRYEDFNRLETAKGKIEITLRELRAAQEQLVQQEKLASLGQLTAGIAHEIKNPLNFVKNFSETSIEMIEEVMEEMEKPHLKGRDEILIRENLIEVKSSMEKVHEHGTRANSIVSSMLQHSRGGSGKMEPTDFNALIKEYVNLCFHGMRAGKNPINVDIVLDLDSDLGMVSLIREDFTRVVINLCNNAFDAMREKVFKTQDLPTGQAGARHKTQDGDSDNVQYDAKLRVSTMLEKGRVRIAFEDNGPGIPDEIKDKILQPFFTTKQGTEGTGLGLSITHDIVKAHGGELEIETAINRGTKFIIKLNR